MEFFAKTFDELTTKELYEILKSRSQIFTIEQNIHCQDMDDIDYNSSSLIPHFAGRANDRSCPGCLPYPKWPVQNRRDKR